MNIKELPQKAKDFVLVKKEQFDTLSKKKKIAIMVAVISLVLAMIFGLTYAKKNKYGVLHTEFTNRAKSAPSLVVIEKKFK